MFFKKVIVRALHKLYYWLDNSEYSHEEERFIKKNRDFWLNELNDYNYANGVVLVYTVGPFPMSLHNNMLNAINISKKEKKDLVVVLDYSSEDSRSKSKIYESYGVRTYEKLIDISPMEKIFALYNAFKLFVLHRNGIDILNLRYKHYYIGEIIYDSILRKDNHIATVKRTKWKDFGEFYTTIAAIISAEKIYNKYDVRDLVYSDLDYMPARSLQLVAIERKITLYNPLFEKTIKYDTQKLYKKKIKVSSFPTHKGWSEFLQQDNLEYSVKKYIRQRFNGTAERQADTQAYINKKEYSREELRRLFNVPASRKNVIIAAHVFSDAAHYSFDLLYQDYYEWLLETIRILDNNKHINVFLKVHPSFQYYFEDGMLEKMLFTSGARNVKLLPGDFNTKSVIDCFDYVVTCQGTMGLEMACVGIPVLTAGKGYYHDFGIDIYSATKEVYENKLMNIQNIPRLSKNTRQRARLALFYLLGKRDTKAPEIFSRELLEERAWNSDIWNNQGINQFAHINHQLDLGKKPKDDYFYQIEERIEEMDNFFWEEFYPEFEEPEEK